MTTTIELQAPFGFSLAAAADFYAGFTPMGGAAERRAQSLRLAFLLDGSFAAVCVELTQRGDRLVGAVEGDADAPVVNAQLTRMLGLDVDGHAWSRLGVDVPALGALQRRWPGFFTAGFPSPWEAGLGGVLSQRASMAQANALRRQLAASFGTRVGGIDVVPSPQQLLAVQSFPGIPAAKLHVLHGLARAALDGALDAEALRALPPEFALARLQSLHGIGPWTAAHMLIRGASTQDVLPVAEPRVRRAFAHVFSLPESDFERASEAWMPFRTWASILMMRALMRDAQWRVSPSRAASTGSSARRSAAL